MDWRMYLDGDEFDLDLLVRRFTEGPVVADRDEHGTYLTGELFDPLPDAGAVLALGSQLLPKIIGMARILEGSFRSVSSAGRIKKHSAAEVNVFTSDVARITDSFVLFVSGSAESRVTITADGEVRSADGTLISQPQESAVAQLWDDVSSSPLLAKAVRQFGLDAQQTFPSLYKVWESLRKLAGSDDQLAAMSGVPEQRIKLLTANSNHQDLAGDTARHSEMGGTPDPRLRISLEEGVQIVKELISGMRAALKSKSS